MGLGANRMENPLLSIPVAVWVGILAALASVAATMLNINSMRKPHEASAAAELTESSGSLVDRLEIRLDKVESRNRRMEERHCALEKKYDVLEEKYDDLLEDYKIQELIIRDIWDGGRLNIQQLRELNEVPKYEPKRGNFRGEDEGWPIRPD